MRKLYKAAATPGAVLVAVILLSSQILYFLFAAVASRLAGRPRRLAA